MESTEKMVDGLSPKMDTSVLNSAKWAFSTRRVPQTLTTSFDLDFDKAVSGDLIIGEVVQIGSHKRVQLRTGRPSALYEGDYVVLACGSRYAADQFFGVAKISAEGFDMLAGGGCAGTMEQKNSLTKSPTRLRPVGMLLDTNRQHINLRDFALPEREVNTTLPAFLVVGASMNSGKTTATAALTHGLTKAGQVVGAIKLTGTGAFGDFNAYEDAGAAYVGDMVDAGFVSTVGLSTQTLTRAFKRLSSQAHAQGCDVLVVELADGILQTETFGLLNSPEFMRHFGQVIYTAGDSLSVVGGLRVLEKAGIKPIAVSGLVSTSPLSTQEAQDFTGCNVFTQADLACAPIASSLINQLI